LGGALTRGTLAGTLLAMNGIPDGSPVSAQCRDEAGVFRPAVDPRRCEGKAECVTVCPYGVFEVVRMSDESFDAMPLLVKLKLLVHGRKTAATPHADACHACGLCVETCPERAITLVRAQAERA
jgi:NAD-dependent dihydropyrimidine dehydrogenase PreA subunit